MGKEKNLLNDDYLLRLGAENGFFQDTFSFNYDFIFYNCKTSLAIIFIKKNYFAKDILKSSSLRRITLQNISWNHLHQEKLLCKTSLELIFFKKNYLITKLLISS